MDGFTRRQELLAFLKAALECSVYLAPNEFGLTRTELLEAGARAGYGAGEVSDLVAQASSRPGFGNQRYLPPRIVMWSQFWQREEPDYRNPQAFEFVASELVALARSQGAAAAKIDRGVLIERAVASGVSKQDIEVALTILVLDSYLETDGTIVKLIRGRETHPLPSEQIQQIADRHVRRVPARERAYAIVKDVVARRTDGRLTRAEPLDAFADVLGALGYGPFRLWWVQMVAELRRTDPSVSPVSACVLSAALVEGALTFVVQHGRSLGSGVFGSKDFDRPPQTCKIEDLVSGAGGGQESAILDHSARQRAQDLVRTRQRIHAGRMLSDFPGGAPDLRPEEAREAKGIAELVVRRICDWLERHPTAAVAMGESEQ